MIAQILGESKPRVNSKMASLKLKLKNAPFVENSFFAVDDSQMLGIKLGILRPYSP